jgi:hypothetical protein
LTSQKSEKEIKIGESEVMGEALSWRLCINIYSFNQHCATGCEHPVLKMHGPYPYSFPKPVRQRGVQINHFSGVANSCRLNSKASWKTMDLGAARCGFGVQCALPLGDLAVGKVYLISLKLALCSIKLR